MTNKDTSKMLIISPHPDDAILGTGGTIIRFIKAGGSVIVLTIAAHMPPLYPKKVFNTTIREARNAFSHMGVKDYIFLNKPALSVGQFHHEINKTITDIITKVSPSILLIPYFDRHIDHRATFESALVASRPYGLKKRILIVAAYEVLSSTYYNAPNIEPTFSPNWIVDISDFIDTKLEVLKLCKSQIGPIPHPRSLEAVKALALFRGSQSGILYGEAFQIIRATVLPEILK